MQARNEHETHCEQCISPTEISTREKIKMSYPLTNNTFRLGTAQNLTVASAAGAAVSTAVFGAQTYAIRVSFPSAISSSTGGVRVKIGNVDEAPVASSTADALLAQNNVPEYLKVVPGERLSAISNNASSTSLSVTEL